MSVLIKNGYVVSQNKICDVLAQENKISYGNFESADKIIDAKGMCVFGGFVDLHCHLRDPGLTYKEDILSGSRAAAKGGFSTVCCMPNTKPVIDNSDTLKYILEHEKVSDVLPVAAITKGEMGQELTDFENLLENGAVAFSDDGVPVESAGIMKAALVQGKKCGAVFMLHEEDMSLRGSGCVNEGENSQKAGLPGIPNSTEEVTLARDIILAKETGYKIHICHISTKGSVDIIRQAKKEGVQITCETQPHYFSLDDSEILSGNTNMKVNPPIRTKADVAAIIKGIEDGTIDAIATDHAPHSKEEKEKGMQTAPFGMSGLETAFSVSYEKLVKSGVISISRLEELMSVNPKKIIGIEDFGLTICDLDESWVLTEEQIVSKGKNSPYINKNLTGRVIYTILKGDIIYDRYAD